MNEKLYVIWKKDGAIQKIDNYTGRKTEKDGPLTAAHVKATVAEYKQTDDSPGVPEFVEDEKIIEVLEFAGFDRNLDPLYERVKSDVRSDIGIATRDIRAALRILEDL